MIYKISGGDVIRAAMTAKKVTVKDAAKALGIHHQTVIKHRSSGNNLTMDTLQKYSDWLDLELSQMFAFAEAEKLLAKGV